jgi:sarcosine oxidase subunit gamma
MSEVASIRLASHDAVLITTISETTSLRLKSWLRDHLTGTRSPTLAGRQLPSRVGETLTGSARVLCVAPGEWLVVSNGQPSAAMQAYFESDLSSQGLALVDLTDGLVRLEVRGVVARELLSKGCGLDLHARSFPADCCAGTRFARIPVVIDCLDEPLRFELHVARSYSQYLYSWLVDAAAEFGSLTGEG